MVLTISDKSISGVLGIGQSREGETEVVCLELLV